MPPSELWLDVAGVRVGLRGNLDFEKLVGPRFLAYRSEPEKGALVVDVDRAAIKPIDETQVVVKKDGVSVKTGTVDGKIARDGKSGRFKIRDLKDLPVAIEALYSHLFIEGDAVLVRGYLVDKNDRGHVLFGTGADRAVDRRPQGSRVRARHVVVVRVSGNGDILADPSPFTGESAGGLPPEEQGSGAGDDQGVQAVQPVGNRCVGLHRIDTFGPDTFDPLPPREGLRVLLEDVVFHDDDREAAGKLLDVLLEVVATVGCSRVIGKAVETFWVNVGGT